MLAKSLSKLCCGLMVLLFAQTAAYAGGDLGHIGTFYKWHKVETVLPGPNSSVTATPNPFEILVTVTFTGPGGVFTVPAFYDADGIGGTSGNVWKVRFSANATGSWTFSSSSSNGTLNGYTGSFTVIDAPDSAPQLLRWGRLQYADGYYLKFADGPYWIKGGIDDPENILGNPFGFGNWPAKKAEIDKLAAKKVNSIYIMFNTIAPGDGRDVWPWWGNTESEAKANHTRFNPGKLLDWEDFFNYCVSKGLVLHLLFDDDSAWHGYDRDLFYREMIARFGHIPALYWNIGEEAHENYTDAQQLQFAAMIKGWDTYDAPLTVHRDSKKAGQVWPFFGHDNFDLTSIQSGDGGSDFTTATLRNQNAVVIEHRNLAANAGRPIPIMIDEIQRVTSVTSSTRLKMRSQVLYPIFLAGGHHEIHYRDQFTQGGNVTIDMLGPMFDDMRIAREFLETMPFHQMAPNNALLSSTSGNFCFAKPGLAYGIYLTNGGTISLDLTGVSGAYQVKWHNVLTGATSNGPIIHGGGWRSLGSPAYSGDVACSVVRTVAYPGSSWSTATASNLGVDLSKLESFSSLVGGNGLVVKDGYVVHQYGDPAQKINWASASKPTNATALFIAIAEGRTTMDTKIYPGYWLDATGKDRNITLRHLANMLSGYMRPENPGAAWSYSDYGVNLFTRTVYQKIFGSDPQTIMMNRLAPLQFQDSPSWSTGSNYGRLTSCSHRDFARMGWMWANTGSWGTSNIVPSTFFDQYCKVNVPSSIPRSSGSDSSDDYLGVGTYGGGTNATAEGPGEYGFFWWQNEHGYWPDAPHDTFMADGHWGGEAMAVIPSLGIVATSNGSWGGLADSKRNNALKLLKESVVTSGSDTQAPTIPYRVNASGIMNNSAIQVTWMRSVDNLAVKEYRVYRDGTLIGASAWNSFTDTGFTPHEVHFYTVAAVDFAGNASAQSTPARIRVQIADNEPPTVPTSVSAVGFSSTMMEVTWTASTDNVEVTGYRVFRDETPVDTTMETYYMDTSLTPSTTYSYTISAYDASGNESAESSPPAVGATLTPDSEPPSVPTNVTAIGLSTSSILVNWTASTDNRGVLGYKVFRNGSLVSTIGATTSYTDTGLSPGTTYSYTVSAYDGDGNESAQSAVALGTTEDVPNHCSIALAMMNVSDMLLHPQNSDGDTTWAEVGGLHCRRPIDTGDQYFYFAIDDNFMYDEPGTTRYLEVSYFDDQSDSVYMEPQYDAIGDGIENRYRSASRVYFTNTGRWRTAAWTLTECKFANRQNVGADFRLYVGPYEVKISSVRVSKIPFSDHISVVRDLGSVEVYRGLSHPQVSGGNTTVTTIDGRDCRKPAGSGDNYFYFNVSDAIMYNGNPSTVYLNVIYYDSPGGMIQPQYDSTSGAHTNSTTINFSGTNTWKQAYWTLENVRFANNQSGSSDFRLYVGTDQSVHIDKVVISKESFEPDTEPPSIPTDVVATAVTETSVELNWTASVDNIGVAGYRIFRNGSLAGTSGTTLYLDVGLEPDTTYSYTVSAFDAAGNESQESSPPVVVTTLADVDAPSVPTGVSAEALSPTEVQVNWTASTDNVGVAGYRIFRNGALAGTSPTPGYLDSEVVSGVSYSYTLSAYDAAGNESAQSSPPAVATTPDNVPPSVPTNVLATVLSALSIELTWTASTDNVGVEGYKIFRDGELVGNTDEASYTDTGLEPETTYSYTVSAHDAAGNESAESFPPAVATTETAMSISEAKLLGDSSPVTMVSKIVSAVFDDFFYVKGPDDYVGIRVVPTVLPEGLAVQRTVDIDGVILTAELTDERYIAGEVMIKY